MTVPAYYRCFRTSVEVGFFFFNQSFLLAFLLQVFDLHSGPKPVVFVLHSFLSAKLTRMGLLT